MNYNINPSAIVINHKKKPKVYKTYSFTSDVLSFLLCPKQYLYDSERGFSPPTSSQKYFGQVVHQTLDRAYLHYAGKIGGVSSGTIPTNNELFEYFKEVERGLFASGTNPDSLGKAGGRYIEQLDGDSDYQTISRIIGSQRSSAFCRLRLFNEIFGPQLYPCIINTEYDIEVPRDDYSLKGTVDVVAIEGTGEVEIWDYKSQSSEQVTKTRLSETITKQMMIYSYIFQKNSEMKLARARIICLGDLDPKKSASDQNVKSCIVDYDKLVSANEYQRAIRDFDKIIGGIEDCREKNIWAEKTDEKTCKTCFIRWGCKKIKASPKYP